MGIKTISRHLIYTHTSQTFARVILHQHHVALSYVRVWWNLSDHTSPEVCKFNDHSPMSYSHLLVTLTFSTDYFAKQHGGRCLHLMTIHFETFTNRTKCKHACPHFFNVTTKNFWQVYPEVGKFDHCLPYVMLTPKELRPWSLLLTILQSNMMDIVCIHLETITNR